MRKLKSGYLLFPIILLFANIISAYSHPFFNIESPLNSSPFANPKESISNFLNEAPVISGQNTLSVNEDATITISLTDITVTDADNPPTDFVLSAGVGLNYTVSGLTITPTPNYSGSITVPVTVTDGSTPSIPYSLVITVNPINDAPVIIGQTPLSVNEDASITISLADITVSDIDSPSTAFVMSATAGTNYTVSGLTITPTPNYSGSITVPVTVTDGSTPSIPYSLVITVNPINDAPVITGQLPLSVNEDGSITISLADITVTDIDSPSTAFVMSAAAGTNYTASGLTITPTPNYSGSITVPVAVTDGSTPSIPYSLVITVNPINDAPVITGQLPLSVNEDGNITISLANITVIDIDSPSTAFVMSAAAGTNYTASGLTITPTPNYSGSITVPVAVTDGSTPSIPYSLVITVNPINDAPVITGQLPLSVNEDGSITISLADITVTDIDSPSTAFVMSAAAGTNYTVSGLTITPTPNYSGSITVPVAVTDGSTPSIPYSLVITVNPINDAPVITGQLPLSVNEDGSITISLANITVTDIDSPSTAFVMSAAAGTNYTASGLTITPTPNYSGSITVPITVTDGSTPSIPYSLVITVNPINDAPVITGQLPLSVNEDGSIAISLANITVTDIDSPSTAFVMSAAAGTNYTASGLTITPTPNYSGSITVPITVTDGSTPSIPYSLVITVNPINDAPVITGQLPLSVNEDGSIAISLANITVTDIDSPSTAFVMSAAAGTNYTVSELTITPTPNYSGSITVPVTVTDGSTPSIPYSLVITVNPINDAPVITGQLPLSVNEDGNIIISLANITVTDIDSPSTAFVMSATAGTNYTVSGLTITPTPNYSGSITVPVTVTDGSTPSIPYSLVITVNPINDAPVITGQLPLSVNEDGSITISLADITVTDIDSPSTAFVMSAAAGTNYTVSGLTITPTPNFVGTLTVPVTVSDGSATSTPFSLAITVNPLNDAPVITGQLPLSVNEDGSITISPADITVTDTDSPSTAFVMSATAGANYTVSGLTITPTPNFVGTLNIPITVSDGSATSNIFSLVIMVTPVNDAPLITGQTLLSVNEDGNITISLANITVTDVDNVPADFTIEADAGSNYTVDGLVVKPLSNFFGTITVRVRVNDGNTNFNYSNWFPLQITVVSINDAPIINSQKTLTILEDESITLSLTDINVSDLDNTYPIGFSLEVNPGANYSVTGLNITPSPSFTGTLTVPIKVNDGNTINNYSPLFNLIIDVTPTNDAPVISGLESTALAYTENSAPIAITSLITISDIDNTNLTSATIQIIGFSNTEDQLGFTATTGITFSWNNATGVLSLTGNAPIASYIQAIKTVTYQNSSSNPSTAARSISILVNDGSTASQSVTRSLSITAINNLPIAESFNVSTKQNQSIVIDLINRVTDAENSINWNSLSTTVNPTQGSLLIERTKQKITYTPNVTFQGSDSFTYSICDSQNACTTGTVTIQVSNEVPEPINDIAVANEDESITIDILVNDTDPQGNLKPSSLSIIKNPTNGSIAINPNFTITYTPLANFNGIDNLDYQICDNDGYCSQATVSITINPINDAPVLQNDIAMLDEDNQVLIDVLTNDNDNLDIKGGIDKNSLLIKTAPTNGTVSIQSSGILYTPNLNFNGSDQFTYSVNDIGFPLPGITKEATVSLTINPVNDAPIITGQANIIIDEDNDIELSLAQLTVLDPDNSYPTDFSLTVFNGSNYIVKNNVITPTVNFYGNLTVPVTVSDGKTISNSFNITIQVSPINDAPLAINDYGYTAENTPININVLANDSDPNDALGGIDANTLKITKTTANSSVIILSNKTINYTPRPGFSGIDTLEYSIGDIGYPLPSKTDTAKIIIEVSRLSPLAVNDLVATDEDVSVIINLLANDTDSGNDINTNSVVITTNPLNGTLSNLSLGKITYSPNVNYHGTDNFTYTIKDFTNLTSNIANVSITINPKNDAPIAINKAISSSQNRPITINIGELATDIDSDLSLGSITITVNPQNGTANINAKTITYTPTTNFTGKDSFKFKVLDDQLLASNEGTVSIDISAQSPTAVNDIFTTLEDVAITLNVATNDTDPQNNINPLSTTMSLAPKNGTATIIEATGYINYVPNSNFNGIDSLIYSICDTDGFCATATAIINVTPVNDAPIANNDILVLAEDETAAIDITLNDIDVENNLNKQSITIINQPLNGAVVVNLTTGIATYQPKANYHGSDSFTYKVCDTDNACSNIATALVTIESVPDAPLANNDTYSGYSASAISMPILNNDTDIDNDINATSLKITMQPKNGSVAINSNNTISYTSKAGFEGTDSIKYSVCDQTNLCDEAKVSLSIFLSNVAPIVTNDFVTTNEDVSVDISPLSNDTDPNSTLLPSKLAIKTQPTLGIATLSSTNGIITYKPNPNVFGTDIITYEICDNDITNPLCSQGTITITILPINDAPIATNDKLLLTDNKTFTINLLTNDIDVDNDILTSTLNESPSNSAITASLNSNGLFTINANLGQYCKTITYKYKTCDSKNLCSEAILEVEIVASDSDIDGISDFIETLSRDSDNDGILDYLDSDSDNDNISDKDESHVINPCNDKPIDTDNDGTSNYIDIDSDGDGISDKEEGAGDCDGDGIPNYIDNSDNCHNLVKIPNTFSPNNDGINDNLIIPSINEYPINELVVFNRWGAEVFRISNYNNTDRVWDGRASISSFGTDILSEGTYYYVLTINNGEKTVKGSIYIKR